MSYPRAPPYPTPVHRPGGSGVRARETIRSGNRDCGNPPHELLDALTSAGCEVASRGRTCATTSRVMASWGYTRSC